jgi:hypothetical protein
MRDPKRVSEVLKTVNANVVGESVAQLCRDAAEIIDNLEDQLTVCRSIGDLLRAQLYALRYTVPGLPAVTKRVTTVSEGR